MYCSRHIAEGLGLQLGFNKAIIFPVSSVFSGKNTRLLFHRVGVLLWQTFASLTSIYSVLLFNSVLLLHLLPACLLVINPLLNSLCFSSNIKVALDVQIGTDVAHVTSLAVVWSVHLGISAAISQEIPYVLLRIMAASILGEWPVEISRTQEYVAFWFLKPCCFIVYYFTMYEYLPESLAIVIYGIWLTKLCLYSYPS